MKKRRCPKLTKEQNRAVWAPTEANAGVGWAPKGDEEPPRKYPQNRERDTEPRLDEVFK